MPIDNKKYYTIGAITKACKLIETLSEKKSWELVELSHRLDMPKTTVHRMLMTLADEGFVVQYGHGGAYGLSLKFFSIGQKVVSETSIVDIVKPYSKKLRDTFNETVNLCVRSGIDMLVLDKQSTSHSLRSDNIVGSSFAIFYSASGRILTAFLSQDEQKILFDKIRSETQPFISDMAYKNFIKELEECQKTGLAYDNEEVFRGVRCVAVPVFDSSNSPVAALSFSTPTVRLTNKIIQDMEKALLQNTKVLSRNLGSTHPFLDTIEV